MVSHRRVQTVVVLLLLSLCVFVFVQRAKPAPVPAAKAVAKNPPAKNPAVNNHAPKNPPVDNTNNIVPPQAIVEPALAVVHEPLKAALDKAGVVDKAKVDQEVLAQQHGYLPPTKGIPLADLEKDIDYNQARMLDFLNGEEGKQDASTPYGVFGGSLDTPTAFNIRTTWNRVFQHSSHLAALPHNRSDLVALGRRVRSARIAYAVRHDQPSLAALLALATSDKHVSASYAKDALLKDLDQVLTNLTQQVFPWISPRYNSIYDMQKYFNDKKTREMGIVFTTGQWHFELAVHAILTLRDVLKCNLPIEVIYMGPNDLTPDMIKAFDSMPGVTTLDVLTKFSTTDINGWAVKPFSILASSFRTTIFIDADSLFFQNPETVVRESMLFKEFGQLFYHDRSMFKDDPVEWFHSINPEMSRYAGTLRYTNKLSAHEMESGVVVVDKGRTGNLFALLMVCQMNSKVERDIAYKHMHGDKETFWISWDMARVPYKFTPNFGGTVGYKNDKDHICGGLFHTDEYSRPLWWNGSVLANKHHNKDSNFMTFEYAAFDTDADKIEWEWETETTPFCLGPRYPEKEVIRLNVEQRQIGESFVQLYKDMTIVGWKKYFVQRYKTKFEAE
ncbi:hypothetical protein HDU98_001126 [Podochytrium sp. JEL0797]|nr:hypothetical protein HDU98_001126 [Podochytrium sp. JEL0797]